MPRRRPKGWLCESDECTLNQITAGIEKLWRTGTDPKTYTPHDPGHFERVEQNLRQLVPRGRWKRLTDTERFLLTCAAWTHDVGMHPAAHDGSNGQLTPREIRQRHVEVSAAWIIHHGREFGLSHAESVLIAEIGRYHSRNNDICFCSTKRTCRGEIVRPQLLAAYLRLADAIEVAHDRVAQFEVPRFLFLQEAIADNAETTLFHWIKSFVVAGVAVSPDTQTIAVEFQAPGDELISMLHDLATEEERRELLQRDSFTREIAERHPGLRLLIQYVLDELRNELETVSDVLCKGGISAFQIVEPSDSILVLRGASRPSWSSGLNRVVNYLSVAYSPNSTGTASAAINAIEDAVRAIEERAKSHGDRAEDIRAAIKEVFPQLRVSLQERSEERSCHSELRRISEFVVDLATRMIRFRGDHFQPWLEALTGFGKTMRTLISHDGDAMAKLAENFWTEVKSRHSDAFSSSSRGLAVLLFGNSATVAQLLARMPRNELDHIHCYIAEGRPKTKHGARNKPIYLDAETYAGTIRAAVSRLYKNQSLTDRPRIAIRIIPDAAVATAIDPYHASGRTSDHPPVDAVIFGANGIFLEPEIRIAHSCGHLGIAAIARCFGVPVYVVANSVKIQDKPHGGDWRRAQREPNEWIGSRGNDIVARLKPLEASASWNPREEQVGTKLLNLIITEQGAGNCDLDSAELRDLLRKWKASIDEKLMPPDWLATVAQ